MISSLAGLILLLVTPRAVAQAPSAGEFPDAWYFYGAERPSVLRQLEGKPAPHLPLINWMGRPHELKDQRGKVVVIDFWATWCGPCVRALPKNVALVKQYGPRGMVMIGVHDFKRGSDRMAAVAKQKKLNYPIAVDNGGVSASLWKVRFWPTYAVVDRDGVVRAAGLLPDRVGEVVEKLLAEGGGKTPAEPAAAASPSGLPRGWLEGNDEQRKRLVELVAAPPPALTSDTWLNSEPLALDELEGKVVVLDFWATWCGPCIRSIPKLNEMQRKYAGQGLVIIGVCHPRGADKMTAVVDQKGIEYAVCADVNGRMNSSYRPNGYPDYFLIDRAGRLRIADCANGRVEEAVQFLLAE